MIKSRTVENAEDGRLQKQVFVNARIMCPLLPFLPSCATITHDNRHAWRLLRIPLMAEAMHATHDISHAMCDIK